MQLLDRGEFLQRGFNQLHGDFHIFVAGVETRAESNGGFRLVAGKALQLHANISRSPLGSGIGLPNSRAVSIQSAITS